MVRFSRRTALTVPVAAVFLSSIGPSVEAQEVATPVAPQLPVTVTDFAGASITVEDVSRIVPLSGDIAEITWDLGLGANIVGVDYSAVYPEELLALPKIGVERNLNAEGILSLNPTVVIGKDAAGPPPILEQVRGAGVAVVIMLEPQTIEAPTVKIRATAAALGVPDAGELLATKVQSEIDAAVALAATATSKPRAMIIYLQEGGVQLVAGGGTVANAMIESAGAIDAAMETGIMGYQPVTSEAIITANPDYIISQTRGVESVGGLDGVLEIPGIAETTAGKNGAILVYDDELLLGMTPRTGAQLMQMVVDLHPELAVATPAATPAG